MTELREAMPFLAILTASVMALAVLRWTWRGLRNARCDCQHRWVRQRGDRSQRGVARGA